MTKDTKRRVVIVGASMAGLRCAEQLRTAGWEDDILVIGEEVHAAYNRPPLSKELLKNDDPDADPLTSVLLRQRASAKTITFLLGTRVISCDLENQTVTTDQNDTISFDGLVVATGVRPRRLKEEESRHVIRTLDDALRLRRELKPGREVWIIGSGFIGCEVAATATELGCDVHLVEGSRGPMYRALGAEVSAAVKKWLVRRGVTLEQELTEKPDVVLVEAIGSIPNVEWLEGNQLDLSDGVLVDHSLRAVGTDNVYAIGDVARYPDPWALGELRRVEHWQGAIDTAKTAAKSLVASLTGRSEEYKHEAIPSFWTDIFETRIQGIGAPHLADTTRVVEGDLAEPENGVVINFLNDDQLIGVVTIGFPASKLLSYREQLGKTEIAT